MVRCNLAVLLAERGLKITKVSSDTGISRTTLTSLANNNSQGVQFDTLNSLCTYLRVTPDELLLFVPVDIRIRVEDMDKESRLIVFNFTEHGQKRRADMYAEFTADIRELQDEYDTPVADVLADLSVSLSVFDPSIQDDESTKDEIARDNDSLFRTLNSLPVAFLSYVENTILNIIADSISGVEVPDNLSGTLTWPKEVL